MPGMIVPGYQYPTAPVAQSTSSVNPTPAKDNTYAASIKQQAQDYDRLMQQYQSLLTQPDPTAGLAAQYQQSINSPAVFNQAPVSTVNYAPSSDVSSALANLSGLAQNGGYTAQGIQDLRSRGTAPIAAAYKTSMDEIKRQKSLQGGYSPNYTASLAKLTRGLSDALSQGTQNVNAGIAQNQASNRLSAAPSYGSLAQAQQSERDNIAQYNAGAQNQGAQYNSSGDANMSQFNAQNKTNVLNSLSSLYQDSTNKKLGVIDSMRALYGTTPALSSLYGSQAVANTKAGIIGGSGGTTTTAPGYTIPGSDVLYHN